MHRMVEEPLAVGMLQQPVGASFRMTRQERCVWRAGNDVGELVEEPALGVNCTGNLPVGATQLVGCLSCALTAARAMSGGVGAVEVITREDTGVEV